MIQATCHICGKVFDTWPWKVKDGRRTVCSRACVGALIGIMRNEQTLKRRVKVPKQPVTYKLIPASNGKFIKVDNIDYDWASLRHWSIDRAGYAYTHNGHGGHIKMHRAVAQRVVGCLLLKSEQVDHVNRVPLDNRRCNLRLCTSSQNGMNKGISPRNTSGYKGVSYCTMTGRWRATIQVGRQTYRLGRYTSALEAAYVRDQFAIVLHGEFAALNVL